MEKSLFSLMQHFIFQFLKVTSPIRSFVWLLISKSSLTWMGLDWGDCYSWQVSCKKCWKFYKLLGFLCLASNTIGLPHSLLGLIIILSKLALKDWDFRNMNYLTEGNVDLACRGWVEKPNRYSWANIQLFKNWSYSHFSQFGRNWLAHAFSLIALNQCGVHDLQTIKILGFFNHFFPRLCILYASIE